MTTKTRSAPPANIHFDTLEQNMFFRTVLSRAELHSFNFSVIEGISKLHLKCENMR